MDQIVVVGAGQAGASLVAMLRSEGHGGPITLIGAEPVPPYQRPPLSKAYLLGEMEEARLYLRPESWYADNDIRLLTDTRVVAIRRPTREVELSTGDVLPYDALALTTGAHPRTLPAAVGGQLDGLYAMRDLRDADALRPELREGAKALVIGGGYIGLEAAAVAAKSGIDVTVVEMGSRILQRVAAEETSDWFRELHRVRGVTVLEGVGLDTLLGDERVTGARLTDGTELALDFAILGIGIAPATALAEGAALTLDNGIATDEFCRTSDAHIWAAGDCASFPHAGGRLRLESVGNAIDMAEAAARNMLGAAEPYVPKPWFWSDQYDTKLQIAGLSAGHDGVVVREADGRSHWYYAGDRLIAVDAMNDSRAYMVGKRLIEGGRSPAPEAVADPSTDLKALLR